MWVISVQWKNYAPAGVFTLQKPANTTYQDFFFLYSGLVVKHWCGWSWINRAGEAFPKTFKCTSINETPPPPFLQGDHITMHTRQADGTHSLLKQLAPLVSGDVGLSWNGSSEAALPDSEWKMGNEHKQGRGEGGRGMMGNGQKRERDSI